MGGIESLLLNLLFIIVFLLFVPLFLDKSLKMVSKNIKKAIIIISACLAIISCLSFPIRIVDGFIFDLRWIPLVIGAFYGGIPTSLILLVTTVGYRFVIGGEGAIANLLICTILVVVSILLIKVYHQTNRTNKILIGCSLSLAAGLLQAFAFSFIYLIDLNVLHIVIYNGLLLISSFIVIYTLEVIREDNLINRKLINSEKMEIVSHLASSISHEVRNPLTVVRGFLQMMEQTALPREERNKFMKICIEEIDRANIIICDYLTFAKPSNENKIEIINVKQEVERSIEIIKPLANMNSVEIETTLDSYHIEGNSQMLQQCLLNITKNCIEAMPNSGKLKVETKNRRNTLLIVIEDNGIGMSEEQLARIGEPYFTTKGQAGTGLGMVAVIRIIQMMKGKLKIVSELNKGSKFQISFPIVKHKQDRTPENNFTCKTS